MVPLQVLRYNKSQAYVAHYDYLESADGHNFDSAGLGTNRFATVSLGPPNHAFPHMTRALTSLALPCRC